MHLDAAGLREFMRYAELNPVRAGLVKWRIGGSGQVRRLILRGPMLRVALPGAMAAFLWEPRDGGGGLAGLRRGAD